MEKEKQQVKCPWCRSVFWYRTEDVRLCHTRISERPGSPKIDIYRVWCPVCGAWVTEKDLKPVERKPHILTRIFKNR